MKITIKGKQRILGLCTLLFVSNVNAQNILVNGDFESLGSFTTGDFTTPAPGWTVTSGIHGNASGWDYSGANLNTNWLVNNENVGAFVNSSLSGGTYYSANFTSDANNPGTICQTVMVNPGAVYNFTGVVAVPSTLSSGALGQIYYNDGSGNVILESLVDQQTSEFSHNIVIGAGVTSIDICYEIHSLDNGSSMIVVDGLSLVAVPEPSCASLLGLGFMGLLARRKRS